MSRSKRSVGNCVFNYPITRLPIYQFPSVSISSVARPDGSQFFQLLAVQRTATPELARYQHDLGVVLHGFHAHVSLAEVASVGDHAVVSHEDGIVIGNEWLEGLAEFPGSGSCIGRQRHCTQRDYDL